MKLIIAILHDQNADPVLENLLLKGFRVTSIASTGGFLRRGSSTLMIGVQEDQLDEAIDTIRISLKVEPPAKRKRATLFVLNVENFSQI